MALRLAYVGLPLLQRTLAPESTAKRLRVPDDTFPPTTQAPLPPAPAPAAATVDFSKPLPEDLERYVTWCLSRITTSDKILNDQNRRLKVFQQQISGNCYEDFLLKKFSKLTDKARDIECTAHVNRCIDTCR